MKPDYEKYTWWYRDQIVYRHVKGGYFRGSFRTFQEQRNNSAVKSDCELRDLNVRVRGSRGNYYLNAWNVEKLCSRDYKKNWKWYHKCRKQWGINLK